MQKYLRGKKKTREVRERGEIKGRNGRIYEGRRRRGRVKGKREKRGKEENWREGTAELFIGEGEEKEEE